MHTETVPRPKLLLQVQPTAKAAQLAPGHDADAVAQDAGLLHAVCCQHDGTSLLDRGYEVPQVPARNWVHT